MRNKTEDPHRTAPSDVSAAASTKRFSRGQWVFGYLIVTFALTFLVSWLIGALVTKQGEPFDWGVCSAAATAMATIALAGGTFILAVSALEDAGSARDLARLTREDMRLRDRPTMRVTNYGIAFPQPKVRFTLENIGLGPATYVTANVSGFDSTGDIVLTTGSVTITHTILPNDSLVVEMLFYIRGNFADLSKTELFMVAIDRRGNTSYAVWRHDHSTGAMFIAASDSDSNWHPDESLLKRLTETAPGPAELVDPVPSRRRGPLSAQASRLPSQRRPRSARRQGSTR